VAPTSTPPADDRDDAFEAALQEGFGPVLGFCRRMLGDRHEGEDAAQQTFLQAYGAWHRFKGRASRRTWLYRIAANVCARMLERRRRTTTSAGLGDAEESADRRVPGSAETEDPLEARESARAVRAALQDLHPAHRMVLVLFCLGDLSHAEIAELLGCPEGTAWSRLHHARKALAAALRRRGIHGPMETKDV